MDNTPGSPRSTIRSMIAIALVVVAIVLAFSYAAGWLSPTRLTPAKLVDSLAPPGGPALGYRRNHAKGICFTGVFESNGAAAALSKAPMFAAGIYPAVGRFNLGTPDPKAADTTVRVRGLGLRIIAPDGSEWRTAMIDAPFFAVSTPEAFYALLQAAGRKDDPDAMKRFVAAHPEFAAFGTWAKTTPMTASYAEEQYNSLDSFIFTNTAGQTSTVRWSFLPEAKPESLTAEQVKQLGPNFLDADITQRVASAPQRWTMIVTVADPGDPSADPSKSWPQDRRKVSAGTLVVQTIYPEANGPCRDLNFDPTVLPSGMHVSDDPFPAARSAAYSVSFNRRTAENSDYPHLAAGGLAQ
ncbi:Catalase-related peroxidase [Paraburkholderia hiiakae]|uniref:Catalase-related peroxidase n=1 Tax=Paraburkholderia hiiakae TaxID=1081782 RepID=A0ABN7HVC1_9BURK|nr:catalase family peroxidase [Paraburkholderia hiiakae]CAD6534166.1 Catalase-related peroxidase [Paraburkholderia hiiakae]